MGISERLAAIEAKLGIETPGIEAGIFWDYEGDPGSTSIGVLTNSTNTYECDGEATYNHFLAFTKEEIARFRAAGIPFYEP